MSISTVIVILLTTAVNIYGYWNCNLIRSTNYSIGNSKNVRLKIAFLSDIHMGALGMNEKILEKVVRIINDARVDLVLFGGDLVERKISDEISRETEILGKIKSKLGSYGVLGNHEYYSEKPETMVKFFREKANIKILMDSCEKIDDDKNVNGVTNITLLGRNDTSFGYSPEKNKNIRDILKFQEEQMDQDNMKNKDFIIVLDHNPERFDEAVDSGVDLQLSGHTHNGQFFPFNLLVKFFYEKAYGRLLKGSSNLIVSSGLGAWGPPLKLFSPPEIVFVNLNLE